MDVQRLRPESRRHNTQGEQLVLPFILATGIENSAPLIAAHGQARYRVDEPAKTRHYERWRDQL